MQRPVSCFDAVRERLDHPILGYTDIPATLDAAACDWLQRRYGWSIDPSALVWLPGVVPGLNLTARAVTSAQDCIVVPEPVYHPFRDVARHAGCSAYAPQLQQDNAHWYMDLERMQAQMPENARLLLLCNPQNPTGRAYSRGELEALGDFCLRNDLYLCSDEIHCELLLAENAEHTPIATLDPALAARTVSLFAPTKTFNMPGLGCAFAVIENPSLKRRFLAARGGLLHGSGALAYAAATAALNYDGPWLHALQRYLQGNYERLRQVVDARLPGRMARLEATYLAWLDLREFGTRDQVFDAGGYFEQHGLGLSDGAQFGGPGFARFNFACPRATLEAGLQRLDRALAALNSA